MRLSHNDRAVICRANKVYAVAHDSTEAGKLVVSKRTNDPVTAEREIARLARTMPERGRYLFHLPTGTLLSREASASERRETLARARAANADKGKHNRARGKSMTTTFGYVASANGRKVHRAVNGHPNCSGVRRGSRVAPVVEIADNMTLADKAAALVAAGVPADAVCESCLGGVRLRMTEGAA